MNKIIATEDKQGLRVEVKGELGFAIAIAATREILKGISQVGPNEVTSFTAAISTILETAFDDPEDRKRIATLLYREFGGDGKCMKF